MTDLLTASESVEQKITHEEEKSRYVVTPAGVTKRPIRVIEVHYEDSQGRKSIRDLYMLGDILPVE